MSEQNDVVLITHTVHADIPEDEARAALPPSSTVRGFVDFRPARLTFDQTLGADWSALARTQRRQWDNEVRPLLERYPAARVVYFGLAPIPLAIHLGSLTERWPAVQVHLRLHDSSRSWRYPNTPDPTIVDPSGPNEAVRSIDPAMIVVSTTNAADIDAARMIVGPTSAEIELRTEPLGEDVLGSERAVHTLAEKFRAALNLLETNRPGVDDIHVFAAIPCGLAFLLGTYITPTRHARIVTYQYHRAHEPRLSEALRLPERASTAKPLDAADREHAAELRHAWETQRAALVAFLSTAEKPWWKLLGDLGALFGSSALGKLETAVDTPLTSPLDLGATTVEDEFQFDPIRRVWLLSDELLRSIREHVELANHDRAGRMLLLHEALHHGQQGLTSSSAAQIRLAPKALEELDYHADVWAILHEFAFEGFVGKPWNEQRQALLDILETAVATMWAFDEDRERGLLEVRRISRYLIWYVVLARIERATSSIDAMAILAEKPLVELIGPHVHMRDERLVARLDGHGARVHELCMLDRRGRLQRLGSTNAVSVTSLATALGAHDGGSARRIVRAFVEHESL